RIEERPEEVLGGLAERGGLLELCRPARRFFGRGWPADRPQVQVLDELLWLELEFQRAREIAVEVADLALDQVTADQEKRLLERERGRLDGRTTGRARAAAKRIEDGARGRRVVDLDRQPRAELAEGIGHVGRLGQRVGHLVGGERPRRVMTEQA